MRSVWIGAVLAVAIAAPAMAQDAAAGKSDFAVCKACHQVGPNAHNSIGPVLNGVVGRKAGTYPGYQYSSANEKSGIVWTPPELAKYLADPMKVVPGTKMIFPGVKDPKKVQNIIAYLEEFGPDGKKK